jgi:hypothetical protein
MGIQLSYYHPKVITSEVENDAALAAAEELAHRPSNSPEDNVLLELLVRRFPKLNLPDHFVGAQGLAPLQDGNFFDRNHLMLIEASAFAGCGAGLPAQDAVAIFDG